MKIRIFLMVAFELMCMLVSAQKPATAHYTVSGGLLGDANFYKFSVINVNNSGYNYKLGWDAGIWVNVPAGKSFAIEPQFIYSYRGYDPQNSRAVFPYGTMNTFSVPLLLKFNAGKIFSIFAGPQFDLLIDVTDNNSNYEKNNFRKTSYALTGGFEFLPHSRITIFGRYVYGLNDMYTYDDADGSIITKPYYRNSGILAGLKLKIFGHHVDAIVPPPPPPPIIDTDHDGILDDVDKCPTVPGVAKYNGCPIPDTDGDGINDEEDKCPTVPGVAKYQGCPIPDTDADGINDEEDKCPTVPGVAKYQGCPIPDTDGDGLNDEVDKCPNVAGPTDNYGCPIIGIKAYEIDFKTGSDKLLTHGMGILDTVVAYLNRHQGVNVTVDGYTDNTGTDKINDPLSVRRAEAAKAYMVSKGIDADRMTTAGFGSKNPIATNKTAAGRKQNRRIEIKIKE